MNLFEFNWECQRCNVCCTSIAAGVPLLLNDVRRISEALNLSQEKFIDRYCNYDVVHDNCETHIPLLTLKNPDRCCVLFGNEGCSVHPVKPYYCKSAPVVSFVFVDPDYRRDFINLCKGFGKGRRYTVAEIKKQLEEEKRLEIEDMEEYSMQRYSYIGLNVLEVENGSHEQSSKVNLNFQEGGSVSEQEEKP
jgi:Fe-S-cluster containining protein